MAKRAITIYIDDLDGTESENGETVSFALDGVAYEVDLCEANADRLRKALAPFTAIGRTTRPARKVYSGKPARTGGKAAEKEKSRNERGLIRAWFNALAEAQRASIYRKGGGGLAPERGRIAEDIEDAYYAYHNRQAVSAAAPAEVKATPGIPTLSARGAMTETMERANKAAESEPSAVVKAAELKPAARKPRKPKPAVPPVAQFQSAGGQAGRSA